MAELALSTPICENILASFLFYFGEKLFKRLGMFVQNRHFQLQNGLKKTVKRMSLFSQPLHFRHIGFMLFSSRSETKVSSSDLIILFS